MNPIERLRSIGQKFLKKPQPIPSQEVPIKKVPINDDYWILGETTGFHYLKLLTPDKIKARGIEIDAPGLIFPEDEMGTVENPVFFRRGVLKVDNCNPDKGEGIYFSRGPMERYALETVEDMESYARMVQALVGRELYMPDALSHWEVLIEPTGETFMTEIDGYTNEATLVGVKSFCAVDHKDLTAGVVVSMEGQHFPICGSEEHPEFDNWIVYHFKVENGEVMFRSTDQIAKDDNPREGDSQ